MQDSTSYGFRKVPQRPLQGPARVPWLFLALEKGFRELPYRVVVEFEAESEKVPYLLLSRSLNPKNDLRSLASAILTEKFVFLGPKRAF